MILGRQLAAIYNSFTRLRMLQVLLLLKLIAGWCGRRLSCSNFKLLVVSSSAANGAYSFLVVVIFALGRRIVRHRQC